MSEPLQIDEFLEAIRTALIDEESGVPECVAENVVVFQHGPSDADEDIKVGISRCKGVSVLIYDLGSENEAVEAAFGELRAEAAVELYVDTTKRNRRKDETLRLAGQIRDDIMQTLHRNPILTAEAHSFYDATVTGYQPVADPAFVVFRITLARSISLDA